jgi:histidinol-phosphate phosphatase family protein
VSTLGVAVIGCGLIGRRRAASAARHPRSALRVVVDRDVARADALAREYGAAAATDWRDVLGRADVGAVVVCTPNALLAPIASEALASGRHVLIEKPMGRNAAEAEAMAAAARAAGCVLKVGFNHRYHPAIASVGAQVAAGRIGRLVQLRARYGHGGRPGCEAEWRGDPELAGGGELIDQGVHIIDLFQWLAGPPLRVHAELQTAVWPLGVLEDNAFGLMRFAGGVVGQFHVSMTQWQNLFSLEVHGTAGALVVEGLGGSYGMERLRFVRRHPAGGVPDVEEVAYPGADQSWEAEWSDFVEAAAGGELRHGSPGEGLAVMRTVAALYRAGAAGSAVTVRTPAVFLDRDGVLNDVVERDGRPGSPRSLAEFVSAPDLLAVRALRRAGYRTFIITNQPDLARGLTTAAEFSRMMAVLESQIPVDEVRVCPHDERDGCACRKPLPGMIAELAAAWNIDLAHSWVIGDSWRDVEAARAAGCSSVLIRRWYNGDARPDHAVDTLGAAIALVTGTVRRAGYHADR